MDDKTKAEEGEKGYDFSKAISSRKQFKFGARDSNTVTVDVSLANLFQRLTVECSGILGNPQWKHFRHMELLKTEQIRLSNGIWRSWHMQFQQGVKPRFCTFEIDPKRDEICHSQPQGIVLEGKYWKRTNSAVAMEYRKWRIYGKKKAKWSSIRRIPNVSTTTHTSMQLGEPQQIAQPDTTEFKLNQIFQAIDDFPESLLMDISRPGDDRSYMRPLVQSAEIIQQQPYLGMLNPHIDEMVFEPMEVMFPSLGLPGRYVNNLLGGSAGPFHYQPPPSAHGANNGLEQPNPRLPNNPQSYSTQMQYENQSSFVNIPQRSPNEYSSSNPIPFNMDPASYLNIPPPIDPRLHPQPDVMDIGTPPIPSMIKPAANPKMYNSGQTTPTTPYATPTPSFVPGGSTESTQRDEDKITSLITQFISEESQLAPPTSTKQQQQATSTGGRFEHHPTQYVEPDDSMNRFETPPRDKTELEMQHMLAREMKRMEEVHLEKIKELEYQQQIASRQYLSLLHEYVNKAAGSQRPSQQQQEVLMTVLSDPVSLNILKEILKDDTLSMAAGGGDHMSPSTSPTHKISSHYQVKRESQSHTPYTPQVTPPTSTPVISPPPSVPPSTSNEMDIVSDFQSRLIMAAAAQAKMNTPTLNSFQPMQSKEGPASSSSILMTTPPNGNELVNLDMPHSPSLIKKFKNVRNLTPDEKKVYQELRRQSHITAEQRRRGSIKSGFDQLQSLVINPASFPSGKISKATILEKTIEHIQGHHQERDGRSAKMKRLKDEMKELKEAILHCQEELPASGAPVTRQRFEENRQMFQEYIRQRTQHNYKFWIYSIIIQQLFDSYNSMVSTSSIEELRQTVLSWFEQSCGLPSLRPIVMNSLRELSMKTSLSDPIKPLVNDSNPAVS